MMRRRVAALLVRLLAAGAVAWSASPNVAAAIGSETPAQREDRAVRIAKDGRDLFDQGRFREAAERFEIAAELARSPVIDLYAARSHRNVGALVRARSWYVRAAEAQLAAGAPEPFTAAVADAKKELAQLDPRIPKATFALERADGAELRVDGARVESLSQALALDPGSHRAELVKGDRTIGETTFELAEGETRAILVKGTAEGGAAPSATPATPTESGEGSLVPGALVTSVGAAGLLLGAITGGLALAKESELADACPSKQGCAASLQPDLDEANLLATLSTVGFIAGGVVSAVGVTLLIVRPGAGDAPAEPAASVTAGPGFVKLTLAF